MKVREPVKQIKKNSPEIAFLAWKLENLTEMSTNKKPLSLFQYDLPEPRQKKRQPDAGGEPELACQKLTRFWVVADMFTFENIAFSHTVANTKYLICADCEIGPVGYHDLATKRCYIALQRVKHVA